VPWSGLLLDAVAGPDNPPGPATNVSCDSAWCFPSMTHLALTGTLGPARTVIWAAICAGAAIAVAAVVLARRHGRRWPLVVIGLATIGMIVWGALM
jgi:hypothetical protein